MSSRHSVLISAPAGIGAVDGDCFARGGSVGPDRRRTKAAFQRGIRLTGQGRAHLVDDIRLEERCRERVRIVHELHDTLLRGFLGASMLLDQAVEEMPADSPFRPARSRALRMVRRAVDEGRAAIRGIHTASPAPSSLEEALSIRLDEVVALGRGVRLRIYVQGNPRALNPAIQEQLLMIGREAVMNALRHSEAAKIEVEVQYRRDLLRMFVRDNGRGINPEALQKESDSHWGLRGMRERAENIGARFGVWSTLGAGTEVRVAFLLTSRKSTPMIRERR
jgi:signal transduction histidine kinase